MHRFILILLSTLFLAGSPQSPFDHKSGTAGDDSIVIFVGEPVYTRKFQDGFWQSRYRVLTLLDGVHEAETIDFIAFGDDNGPEFSTVEGPILLYIQQRDTGRHQSRYGYKPLYKIAENDWAVCGSPYQEKHEAGAQPYNIIGSERPPIPIAIDFDLSAEFDIRDHYISADISDNENSKRRLGRETLKLREERRQAEIDAFNQDIDRKFRSPLYQRDGYNVRCLMGIPVKEAVDHELATIFRIQHVKSHCDATFAHLRPHDFYDWVLMRCSHVSGDDRKTCMNSQRRTQAYRIKTQECFDSLYSSGWPYEE